jgi:pimeloyl-ACP methyl ester carboxylesterase
VETLGPKKFEVIEGAGHLVMHEAAPEVNALIENFFAQNRVQGS